jgi:hypothetical protein
MALHDVSRRSMQQGVADGRIMITIQKLPDPNLCATENDYSVQVSWHRGTVDVSACHDLVASSLMFNSQA